MTALVAPVRAVRAVRVVRVVAPVVRGLLVVHGPLRPPVTDLDTPMG